jgi:hypothetical protein
MAMAEQHGQLQNPPAGKVGWVARKRNPPMARAPSASQKFFGSFFQKSTSSCFLIALHG